MANTNAEIIAMLETNPSQAIRGVLDTLYLYNPATVNDLIAQLNDVINKVGFEAIVVDVLPETGKKGTIYFVPSGGETPNVYNEYVWVTETEKFEMVGSAQVDLSNYYTKGEVDKALEGLDPLPDQTDNAGKFLKTDGTTASWGKAIENSSVYGFGVYGGTAAADGVAIGAKTNAGAWGVAIGYKATSVNQSYAIGEYAKALGGFAIAFGYYAEAGAHSVAIGESCYMLGESSIGLGYTGGKITENYVFYAGKFKMLDLLNGTIPTDRYAATPTTAGTYVPKLTVAEDGTTSREWGTESGGGTSVTIRNWE